MTTKALPQSEALHDYLLHHTPEEPELLARLAAETDKLPRATMRLGWPQGRFLQVLVALMGARRVVEVGVFTGYSSVCLAQALPQDGLLVGLDNSREWTDTARRYWREAGVEHKIDLRLGEAAESLDALLAEHGPQSFDLAFIDADKVNYQNYFERCLRLVRPGGLLAVDNTLWYGRVVDPDVQDPDTLAVRAFNARLKTDPRVLASLTPIGDGLSLAVKLG